MKTLVINSGSSSIKYQLLEMPEEVVLCSGLIERIGEENSHIEHWVYKDSDLFQTLGEHRVADHRQGMKIVAQLLTEPQHGPLNHAKEVEVVGHRVVHGGEAFSHPTLINDEVTQTIRRLSDLAPLHNPPNLTGIEMTRQVFKQATQVAVFDTAFHQTLPPHAYRYALPNELYQQHGIRVYGFHGTSHRYITAQAAQMLGKPVDKTSLISIHLGNGASMTAVQNGQSIDTTLGMTPLPGLVMGTRSGDIDPAIIFYLHDHLQMPLDKINHLLNKESGMKGLTGHNDLREIIKEADAGSKEAQLALEIYTYRIKKYIGAYVAVLGRIDAVVFTGGVGENSPLIRQMALAGLTHLGIGLQPELNEDCHPPCRISAKQAPIQTLVIPTNEELEIARQAYALVSGIS